MPELQVSLTTSPFVIAELRNALRDEAVKFSEPIASESPADALDSPMGAVDIKQLTEMIVVILQLGTVSLGFAKALIEVLKAKQEPVVLRNPRTGKAVARLDAHSTVEEASAVLEQCFR